jgi:hypothetical protein
MTLRVEKWSGSLIVLAGSCNAVSPLQVPFLLTNRRVEVIIRAVGFRGDLPACCRVIFLFLDIFVDVTFSIHFTTLWM